MKNWQIPFFRIEKSAWLTVSRERGSSVTKRTLSLLTLAKSRRSVNSRAQKGRTERPSTRLRSPPNIHCLPGELNTNGWNMFCWIRFIFYLNNTKVLPITNSIGIGFYRKMFLSKKVLNSVVSVHRTDYSLKYKQVGSQQQAANNTLRGSLFWQNETHTIDTLQLAEL